MAEEEGKGKASSYQPVCRVLRGGNGKGATWEGENFISVLSWTDPFSPCRGSAESERGVVGMSLRPLQRGVSVPKVK